MVIVRMEVLKPINGLLHYGLLKPKYNGSIISCSLIVAVVMLVTVPQ